VRENVGRYRIKSISLWRKDDFRNEELTRQTGGQRGFFRLAERVILLCDEWLLTAKEILKQ